MSLTSPPADPAQSLPPQIRSEIGKVTARKIARRLLPFLFILYIVSYLDRANVAFAKLPMVAELGFSEAVFGFGAGIFFIGYLLLEIPGALIVEHWSARKWIARIMISWGICTVWLGFVRTPGEFYWARFLLGVAEAGFFPGIIVYLSHWFAGHDRARAMSGFIMAVPFALVVGAPISAFIMGFEGLGLSGWRWMFILEGLPAIILGLVTWKLLPDRPDHVKWLNAEEKSWITNELRLEKEKKRLEGKARFFEAFKDRNAILLAAALFMVVQGSYCFVFWLPTTIHSASGLSPSASTLLSALPFALGFIAVFLLGRSSDRTGERKLHTVLPMMGAGIFLGLSAIPNQPFLLLMVWLSLAGSMLYAWGPSFWALPTLLLGESAAAVSVGFINCVGNLGGFVGPVIVGRMRSRAVPETAIVSILSGCFLLGALLVLLTRVGSRKQVHDL